MKNHWCKFLLASICLLVMVNCADAQKKGNSRASTKRAPSTVRKTAKGNTKGKINQGQVADSSNVVAVQEKPKAAVDSTPANDSLPVKVVKKSLRPDEAVDMKQIRDRTPLPYENLRADDAVYRHKIWREIDAREKINLPFRYAADENNGNQRFISILFKAIQDSEVTVFSSVDDRFTTPMTRAQVLKQVAGDAVEIPVYDEKGNIIRYDKKTKDIVLDSFLTFHIKEEVIFDKESSRLFWRILGIAPVMNVYSSQTNVFIGTKEIFWVYYPDLRPTLAKYEIFNGKNYGARMTWEELFEGRMFSGRIIKSTMENPFDKYLDEIPGLKGNGIFQLLEGEKIKEKIFNYEQDLWSY